MSALLNSELLEDLHTQVADDAYRLYEALAVVADEQSASSEIFDALADCAGYLQHISEYAERARLTGLQAICQHIQQDLLSISAGEELDRAALCCEMEGWPRLISNYLHRPSDEQTRLKLVDQLQQGQWHSPLSEDEALVLNSQLADDFTAWTTADEAEADSFADLADDAETTDLLLAEEPEYAITDSEVHTAVTPADEVFSELADTETALDELPLADDAYVPPPMTEPSDLADSEAEPFLDTTPAESSFDELSDDEDTLSLDSLAALELSDVDASALPDDVDALEADALMSLGDELESSSLDVDDLAEDALDPSADEELLDAGLPPELDESDLESSAEFDDELPSELDESDLEASAEFDDELPSELDESDLEASAEFDDELPSELDESDLETSAEFDDELPSELDESDLETSAEFDDELPSELDESDLEASAEFDDELPSELDESDLESSAEFDDELPSELDESDLESSAEFDDELPSELDESDLESSAEFDDELPSELDESDLEASAEFDDELPSELDESDLESSAEFDDELPSELDESDLESSAEFDDELPSELDESDLETSAEFDDELPSELDESDLESSAEFDDELPSELDESDLETSAEFDDELPSELDESDLEASAEFDDELPSELDESDLETSAEFDDELPSELDESDLETSAEFDDELPSELDESDLETSAEFDDELPSELDESDLTELDETDLDTLPDFDESLALDSSDDSTDEFSLPEEDAIDAFSAQDALSDFDDENHDVQDQPDLSLPESNADSETNTTNHAGSNVSLDTSESNRRLDETVFGEMDHEDWSLPVEPEDTLPEDVTNELEDDHLSDELEDEDSSEVPVLLPDDELDTMIDEAAFSEFSQEQPVLEKEDTPSPAPVRDNLSRFGTDNKFEQLSNHIVGASDSLSNNLQQFVTNDEESEEFLLAIEQYTNEVQILWELAENTQLKGVQDVCTFINDNLFELSTQDQPARFVTHELFAAWPGLVLEYLQSPNESAAHLVQHLQNPQWPQPLSAATAETLKKQLIQETVIANVEYGPSAAYLAAQRSEPTPAPVPDEKASIASSEQQAPETAEEEPAFSDEAGLDDELDDDAETPVAEPEYDFSREDLGEAFLDEDVLLDSETDELADEQLPADIDDLAEEAWSEEGLPELDDELSDDLGDLDDFPADFAEDDSFSDEDAVELPMDLDELNNADDLPPELLDEEAAFEEDAILAEDDYSNVLSDEESESLLATDLSIVSTLQLADANTLDNLRQEIADAIADLDKAKLKFLSATDDSEDLLEAVERYSDNVQAIHDAGERAELTGIMTVCQFINDNIFELSSHGHAIRRAAEPYLEAWPSLLQDYLTNPLHGAPLLVEHLSSTGWPLSLEPEQANALLSSLTQGQLTHLQDEHTGAATAELEPSVAEAEAEALLLADPDVIMILSGQVADSAEALENILHELVTAPDGDENLLTYAEAYTEQVQAIWDAADMAGLQGVQTVCTFINDNIMGFAMQEQVQREATQNTLSEWPGHLLGYLEQPEVGAVTLIEHLQHTDWPEPLTTEAATALQEQLLSPAQFPEIGDEDEDELLPEADSLAAEMPLVLADEDVLMLLSGQVVDSAEELNVTLSELVNAEDDSEETLMAASTYTEQVQALWDAAEMSGLSGLQTVCTLVNDNVMLFAALDQETRQNTQSVFSQWPEAVQTYLSNPREGAAELVTLLQDNRWPQPVEDPAALEQELLTPAATSAAATPVATEEAAAAAEIVLADPDVLMLVIGQVADTADEVNATLAELVNAEDGSEELLMTASTYTEQVQGLWDAADMAGLTGVQEVCTFVNDNVMLFAGLEQANRQNTQAVFADWPINVQNYLEMPATGAATLIQHLQDSRWPQPLDAEAASHLQQTLLTSQAPSGHEIDTSAAAAEITLAAPEIIELLQGQINDTLPELSAALEECVAMETENPAFLEAIENYTNQVQAIWDAADMAGLQGIQEVCTFVNDNLMAFSTLETEQRQAVRDHFAQWPVLLLDYLSTPTIGAERLIEQMQNDGWPQPLEAERAEEIQALLKQPSSSVEQQTAYESEMATEIDEAFEEEADEAREPLPELDVESSSGEVSLGSEEAVEILTGELESSKEELAEELGKFLSLDNGAPGFEEATENYGDIVMRLHMAAEMLGLEGLQAVCNFIAENVRALGEKDKAARNKAKKWLETWPEQVQAYLQSPQEHVIGLVNNFRESAWPQALSDEGAHELLNQLMQGSTVEEDEEEAAAYARQTVASPEDVIITPPEDVNQELLEAYLQEVPQHATDFSAVIQSIIANPQVPDIERAQRIAHTLKGSSNIIGIKGIANVAHHLEDTLEYLAQKQVVPPKELTDTMVEAADCLEGMVDALLGQDDAPPNSLQVLQSVLDWANQIDKGKLNAPPAPKPVASAEGGGEAAAPVAQAAAKTPAAAPAGGATSAGSPEQFLRVPTRTVDDLMRLVGELSIAAGQIQERLRHVTGSTRLLIDHSMVLQQKTFELENLVDVRGITGVETRYGEMAEVEEDFDPLEFEEYNELHSVAHSFIESIADSRELAVSIRGDLAELETMFIQQERLNKEFQATIMTTRMVPVATIVSKLQRNVRQTCRATGKQAELEVLGTDIMIDSDVLDKLGDPLMHILRNSVDHGIEPADERAILGKPEAGNVQLKFYREGNNIVVSCKDDGAGLNYTNIRYTAIQRGLITENQDLSENELARLILMSGFSTKSGVTQVSGRGVGMDVVHTNIREMKGTLDLTSETGHGTLMIIKLPMSLVTVHILLVRIGTQRYGIPTNHLEQVLAAGVSEFHKVGEETTLKMGKHMHSLKSLGDLLAMQADKPGIEGHENRPIVLVHEETGTTAVVVDELLDTHDLVMKTMGKYVKNVHGVAGASILGDGSLVPVLDLPQLLRSPMQAAMNSYMAEQGINPNTMAAPAGLPKVLIVDDSLSVRKSLSLLVEDAGFDVMLAKDGVEAIEVMGQHKPNVMLVDMEMPRMNGLELTSHVRANPETKKMPIFMITSRTTEKHREQAKNAGVSAYLTKPYQDTELLDLIDKGLAGKI